MICEKVPRDEWNKIAENMHLACFGELRPADVNTFHHAYVVFTDDKIYAYATIIEMDKFTAHMQHGGAVPEVRGSVAPIRAYKMVMNEIRSSYKRATTHIRNTNIPMLKMAMSEGFRIIGLDHHDDGVYLHLYQEFTSCEPSGAV